MTVLIRQPLEYWMSGGPLLLPLAAVCFGIWFYFLKSRAALVSALSDDRGMEDELVAHLRREPIDRCRKHFEQQAGLVGRVLAATLGDVQQGSKPAEAFDTRQSAPLERLGRDFKIVAALTAAAPLLGLLGTVLGMIETFDAVSVATGETTGGVASGISQALITTQFGLIIAIPGVFGLSRLQRLRKQVRMRMALCKTHLMVGLGLAGRAGA